MYIDIEVYMKEYDDITLKRLQSIELMMLNDFKAICKKHDIPFFAYAGSGIGVLRHKGFIPWDDDIDIGFVRDDYERFLKVAKEEMSDKYTVMNNREDKNYPLMTTRLMLNGTKFREIALKDINCSLGIFLDLYPFDKVPKDKDAFLKQNKKAWWYSHLLILRSIPFPALFLYSWKEKVIHFITAIVYGVLKICGVSKKFLAGKCEKIATQYNDLKDFDAVNWYFDTAVCSDVFYMNEIFPLKELPFENTTLTFPNDQDRYLRNLYGDYMTMPPEDRRKNHFPYELDFGIYKDISLEILRNPDLYIDSNGNASDRKKDN